MIRLLFLIGLAYLLYVVMTRPLNEIFGPRKPPIQKSKGSPKRKSEQKQDAEEMAACGLCGTFISKREGELRGGKFVCKPHCHS